MKRTPLKSKSQLKQKTALKAKTPLKNNTQLKSKTTLKTNSKLKQNTPLKKNTYTSRFAKESTKAICSFSKQKRIVSLENILSVKKHNCEFEGCNRKTEGLPHHIRSVGSGGDDIKENLIQLCSFHHIEAHSGKIKKQTLFLIVEKRESISYEQLIEIVYKNRKVIERNNYETN